MEPERCASDLACPASAHDKTCPWHPANTLRVTVPESVFEQLTEELDRPARPMPKLRELLGRARQSRTHGQGRAW